MTPAAAAKLLADAEHAERKAWWAVGRAISVLDKCPLCGADETHAKDCKVFLANRATCVAHNARGAKKPAKKGARR